jgi:hypothetical protein
MISCARRQFSNEVSSSAVNRVCTATPETVLRYIAAKPLVYIFASRVLAQFLVAGRAKSRQDATSCDRLRATLRQAAPNYDPRVRRIR